ncbi:inositol polyphosphate 5-phosphatase K-like isoform X2 [Clarias magur]|uniref:Inositol polyphosphate 5-phosphatase K-like isoform X2 n=1 Tax=Clarias magur TaxID=1594786 RepID=A0A8J4U316_CLAMG|nr:inositol polyphosphate 5-phosphatase K-like isoform X2 [Clarias magur]
MAWFKTNFKSPSDYTAFVWVKEDGITEINDVVQLRMNKDDIPSLAGDYILVDYSRNMQSLVFLSPTFQRENGSVALKWVLNNQEENMWRWVGKGTSVRQKKAP